MSARKGHRGGWFLVLLLGSAACLAPAYELAPDEGTSGASGAAGADAGNAGAASGGAASALFYCQQGSDCSKHPETPMCDPHHHCNETCGNLAACVGNPSGPLCLNHVCGCLKDDDCIEAGFAGSCAPEGFCVH
jgi:hypothetical protein